jgi:hypothetical protein
MAPPPRFDHEEARRLYAAGVSRVELAERYGVTVNGIYRVTASPEVRARYEAYQEAKQQSYRVPCANGCGALVHGRYRPGRFCVDCATKERATSVRPDTLHCSRCDLWLPDSAFPSNKAGRGMRRGRHAMCRACSTEIRREYRERNKVPCSHGCGTMVLHENGGKPPECHPCAVERVKTERRQRVAA